MDRDGRYLAQKIESLRLFAEAGGAAETGRGRGFRALGEDPLDRALYVMRQDYRLRWRTSGNRVGACPAGPDQTSQDRAEQGQASPDQSGPDTSRQHQAMRPQAEAWAARLTHIARANHWRVRKVSLGKDFHRWTTESLLGFYGNETVPVAIRLQGANSVWFDPQTGRKRPLTPQDAALFAPYAYRFYETFPDGPLSWGDVARFVLRGSGKTFLLVLCVSCLAGFLGLVQPLAVEYVSGQIIPTANLGELRQLGVLLLALAFSQVFLSTAPNLFLLAYSIRRMERFESAMFDRLLRIPVDFFRDYTAGDLSERVTAIAKIQERIFNVLTGQVTDSLLSLFSLIMLLYYSWQLTLVGLTITFVYCSLLLLLRRSTLPALHELAGARGRMAGLLNQFLDGIAKIRGSGAEKRIIARYLDDFIPATHAAYTVHRNTDRLALLATLFPSLVSVLFFWLVGDVLRGTMQMPQYLAFIAAFSAFQSGVIGMCDGLWKLWEVRPELTRIKPLLSAPTESAEVLGSPGVLDGNVEISHLTLRYAKDRAPVLDDVSLHAAPGEFIAIVGPSGAGKSSLVRALLGFERPERGSVLYSGRDLAELDAVAVRRQLGVILQNSRVMPGSILSNIIAGTDRTFAEAQEAVKLAALDQDLETMPMGLFTMVGEGLLSGGQEQRLLIARALVGSPAILIMDESTSALDNVTQETIRQNIENLRCTRIVVAHRLSTIIHADRIYVLEAGRVRQCGDYKTLLAKDGPFKSLAKHQLV